MGMMLGALSKGNNMTKNDTENWYIFEEETLAITVVCPFCSQILQTQSVMQYAVSLSGTLQAFLRIT